MRGCVRPPVTGGQAARARPRSTGDHIFCRVSPTGTLATVRSAGSRPRLLILTPDFARSVIAGQVEAALLELAGTGS
jgi:hypothetical protein